MDVNPAAWGDWMSDWSSMVIWMFVMSTLIVVAIVWGVVMVVRALAARNNPPAGSRTCKSCGVLVHPGNTQCPTCRAQMDWT